jgi:hypothetical protein
VLIPVAARSKARCGRSIAVIAGSNPAEGMDVHPLFVVYNVGSDLCDELITRSEKSYQVCVCVSLCDL